MLVALTFAGVGCLSDAEPTRVNQRASGGGSGGGQSSHSGGTRNGSGGEIELGGSAGIAGSGGSDASVGGTGGMEMNSGGSAAMATGGSAGAMVDPDNLFPNPGFENETDPWKNFGGGSLQSSELHHSGSHSALLTERDQEYQGIMYDATADSFAGKKLSVSGWVQTSTNTTVKITINYGCTPVGDAAPDEDFKPVASVSAKSTTWVQIKGTYLVPNCTLTKLFIYFEGAPPGVDIYLDDVSLKIVP